jgi:hypothetical protein
VKVELTTVMPVALVWRLLLGALVKLMEAPLAVMVPPVRLVLLS